MRRKGRFSISPMNMDFWGGQKTAQKSRKNEKSIEVQAEMAAEAQNKARKLGITCPDTLWEVSSLRSAYLVLRDPQ